LASTCLTLGILLLYAPDVSAQTEPDNPKACGYCGMHTEQYAHSRMHITNEDGSVSLLCSLHCAAIDLAVHLDKTPRSIQVGDYSTKKLIDAEKAVWVIGGSLPGVMSRRGKWAFAEQSAAQAFIKTNGGIIATFDQAAKAAYEDMHEDTKMIRERRKMKRAKMTMDKKEPGQSALRGEQ
ncbi:MAG TPA: nitrous oxide reductase accessory protein NosL, partial [Clostridia bacterium]|nr:nitrous oxide reductase accessory protein NosL [Clostridia bacterium]